MLYSKNNNNNRTVVPGAKEALNQMKLEIANELGMSNYQQVDKGNLTARENGYVGGYMTKKLVEMAEQQMAGKSNR
ncbi:alpha/beta-type small acid-soluble spore protein [Clostridioides difficile]|uniref:alpha/beta-type small acid-soluble spore protein n=6 Tax=Clostridioides difficile TaxID=1496 RepID=UPI000BB1E35F|nr:alpha/beta-type small acid-soluble spore protein [Clostridioides difficile]